MTSPKNLPLILLGLTVAVLGVLAWKQHLELVELRASALTNGSRADWQKRLWASQKRAQELESQLTNPTRGPAGAGVPAPATAAGGPGPGPMMRGSPGNFTSVLERPEAARLIAIQQKGQIDARFAALFKKLGLPNDKLAQFKALLADKLSAPLDVIAAAGQQGVDPVRNPQEFSKLVQDTQGELDEKIKGLLPSSGYSQYQDYLQTEPQRSVVSQLQQALSYSDTQITPAQADQLVQILAETSPATGRQNSGFGNMMMGPVPPGGMGMLGLGGTTITDEAITRAQSVLSPPQVQALQDIQQQQQAAGQLRQLLIQNFGGRGATPPPPPSHP